MIFAHVSKRRVSGKRTQNGTQQPIGKSYSVARIWFPNVEGNDATNKLARLGLWFRFPTAQPQIPIPHSVHKLVPNDWWASKHTQWWDAYWRRAHTKRFLSKPSLRWSKDLLLLERVSAITGQCGWEEIPHMVILQDSRCSCGFKEETRPHVICQSTVFSSIRPKILANYVFDPSENFQLELIILNRFLVQTNRFF